MLMSDCRVISSIPVWRLLHENEKVIGQPPVCLHCMLNCFFFSFGKLNVHKSQYLCELGHVTFIIWSAFYELAKKIPKSSCASYVTFFDFLFVNSLGCAAFSRRLLGGSDSARYCSVFEVESRGLLVSFFFFLFFLVGLLSKFMKESKQRDVWEN